MFSNKVIYKKIKEGKERQAKIQKIKTLRKRADNVISFMKKAKSFETKQNYVDKLIAIYKEIENLKK